jgi:hypothetical protein
MGKPDMHEQGPAPRGTDLSPGGPRLTRTANDSGDHLAVTLQRSGSCSPARECREKHSDAAIRDRSDGSECRGVAIRAPNGRQVWLAEWPATAAQNRGGATGASRRTAKQAEWPASPNLSGPMRRTASAEIRTAFLPGRPPAAA